VTAVLRLSLAAVAEQLGLAVSPMQQDALLTYLALLQRWNTTYNLTAMRDAAQMLTQHVADCMAVVAPLKRQLGATPHPRLLDVGSGAGLPGVVLAALIPGLSVTCVDSVGKKAAFVRQAATELGLANLHADHGRVEQLAAEPFTVITSRAFSSLSDFVAGTSQLLAPEGVWMAMKGKRPDAEIAELPESVRVFHVEPLSVPGLTGQRCLVWVRPNA
jgi:16S rRNA (guanine527-N7)-methyltransferase